jgi:hypothetical protein
MNGHAAMSLLHFKKRHSARKLALRSPTATPSKAFSSRLGRGSARGLFYRVVRRHEHQLPEAELLF